MTRSFLQMGWNWHVMYLEEVETELDILISSHFRHLLMRKQLPVIVRKAMGRMGPIQQKQ